MNLVFNQMSINSSMLTIREDLASIKDRGLLKMLEMCSSHISSISTNPLSFIEVTTLHIVNIDQLNNIPSNTRFIVTIDGLTNDPQVLPILVE